MNDAVWYLYLADVVGGLGNICGMLGGVFGVATLVAIAASILAAHGLAALGSPPAPLTEEEKALLFGDRYKTAGEIAHWDRLREQWKQIDLHYAAQAHNALCRHYTPRLTIVAGLFLLGGVLTPSQNTLYAAAAVSVGKDVAATATAQKAVKALDAWLDRQISGDGNKEESK